MPQYATLVLHTLHAHAIPNIYIIYVVQYLKYGVPFSTLLQLLKVDGNEK